MNIILINICLRPYFEKLNFPTGFAYVATALEKKGYPFDLIDLGVTRFSNAELEQLLRGKNYDIVAFGTLVSGYKYAKELAEITRRTNPNATIIAGNSVASSIPNHLLNYTEVDVAVKGEGERTICKLVETIENKGQLLSIPGIVFRDNGNIIDTGYEIPIKNISDLFEPNWNLFDMESYLSKSILDVSQPYPIPEEEIKAFVVNTARGCPFSCSFCYHVFQYTKYRYRSAESILSEVDSLQGRYGVNYINFSDELTFFSRKQASDFADVVLSNGMKFYWNANIRSGLFSDIDLSLLRRLKHAGCLNFKYSLESGNTEILKSMNKRATVEQFRRQKIALDKAGIGSATSLVLGYPQETPETLEETFNICYELDIYPSTGYLLPQPGTPMFEVAREKGFVESMESYLMRMGDRQDLRFNLTKMSDELFEAETRQHLRRIAGKLGLGFQDAELIKTTTFQASNPEKSEL